MVTGRFDIRIRPYDSRDNDYQSRAVGVELTEQDIVFPENITSRQKSIVLNTLAAQRVYLFCALDGVLSTEDARTRILKVKNGARQFLPEEFHSLLEEE